MACLALLIHSAAALSATTAKKSALKRAFAPKQDPILCGPISKAPLSQTSRYYNGVVSRSYTDGDSVFGERLGFVDLVEEKRARTVEELVEALQNQIIGRTSAERVQEDTFRNPFVSFVYERGWRDSFKRSGFPGIDAEFEEVQEFFGDALDTGAVLDVSCGTGLMSRRLARVAGPAARLISADYSESMLLETKRRFDGEDDFAAPELYRVDVANLPFQTASLDAAHAGAALHCWVQLEEGLAEVRRSLKPGGKFFATTFLVGAMGTNAVPKAVRDRGYRFFTVEELEGLMRDAGFDEVDVRREDPACAVIKCSVAPDLEPAAAEGSGTGELY